MLQILKLLWPFVLEVFVNNKEVTSTIKKPSFLLKFVVLIVTVATTWAYIYEVGGELLINTHKRYTKLSNDYLEMEEKYRLVLDENSRLKKELQHALETKRSFERTVGLNQLEEEDRVTHGVLSTPTTKDRYVGDSPETISNVQNLLKSLN